MPAFAVVLFVLTLFVFGSAAFLGAFLIWVSSEKRAYREPRTIICPENLDYVRVTVDGDHAAKSAMAGREEFRIATCSRWPEMKGCDQECAVQVTLVGDDRTHSRYAAFGMTPGQLRSETPVKMTPDLFGVVMRDRIERYMREVAMI